MFMDVSKRLNDPAIVQLLASSLQEDADRLEAAVLAYRNNPHLRLYGIESEGEVIGVIGYRHVEPPDSGVIAIEHLAVRPDCRGGGYGRGLILELIARENPQSLVAETDEEAVEFYRHIGFTIESLGEPDGIMEMFRCSYSTVEED